MAKQEVAKQQKPVTAEVRTTRGSRKAQYLRATGKIPGVVYGLQQQPVLITLPLPETLSVLQSGSHILEVAIEGKAEKMLIQDVQYDYLNANVEHVDLLRIDPNKKVKVKVALDFRGTPKGTKEGGILETQATEVELEVSPLAIPSSIRVNVENLEMHQILHAKEVALPEGATLVDFADKIICQVRTVKEEVAAATAEAGPAEPEVIGKKKEEEGAEGAAGGETKGGAPKAGAAAKK
jgi:large subunit ribosomal protein L25